MPDWMTPGFMSSKPPGSGMQALRFDSDPPGVDVRTAQGQTCQTPCSLTVPTEAQAVTFVKEGFVPQTVQVSLGEPPDHSFWESPPPSLNPNPLQVVMQALPPRKPDVRHKPRKSVTLNTRTRTAAKTPPPPPQSGDGGGASPFPDPQPMQPDSSVFPPPPQTQ